MAMARALLLLALVACAQALPLDSAAEGAGYTMFGKLLDFLGLTEDLPADTKGTLFAPSDAAITEWLSDMQGMTLAELLERPQLVDQLVSYHFVPGLTITESKKAEGLISKDASKPNVLWTGDIDSTLRLSRSPSTGLLQLQDAQGNKASVVSKKPTMDGQIAIWGISSVLWSKSYYDSHNDALKAFPQFSTSYELSNIATHSSSKAAALNAALESGPQTFLIPTNKAWGPAGKLVASAKPDTLVSLFQYHTLPGIRTVPAGFKSGAKVETALKGHTIKTWINDAITRVSAYTGEKVPAPLLTVVPEVGKPAQAIYPNIFAGKDVIHGMDRTLTPYGVPSLVAKAAGRRHLLQSNRFNRQNNAMLASSNTQAAIRAAARGQVPVSSATRIGSLQSRAVSGGSANNAWLRWGSIL